MVTGLPSVGIGTGAPGEHVDRILVFTILISAPQHVHRMGGRCLIQAIERAGSNFSSTCSKAMRRLQFGCRNPKLRARRKPVMRCSALKGLCGVLFYAEYVDDTEV